MASRKAASPRIRQLKRSDLVAQEIKRLITEKNLTPGDRLPHESDLLPGLVQGHHLQVGPGGRQHHGRNAHAGPEVHHPAGPRRQKRQQGAGIEDQFLEAELSTDDAALHCECGLEDLIRLLQAWQQFLPR